MVFINQLVGQGK